MSFTRREGFRKRSIKVTENNKNINYNYILKKHGSIEYILDLLSTLTISELNLPDTIRETNTVYKNTYTNNLFNFLIDLIETRLKENKFEKQDIINIINFSFYENELFKFVKPDSTQNKDYINNTNDEIKTKLLKSIKKTSYTVGKSTFYSKPTTNKNNSSKKSSNSNRKSSKNNSKKTSKNNQISNMFTDKEITDLLQYFNNKHILSNSQVGISTIITSKYNNKKHNK